MRKPSQRSRAPTVMRLPFKENDLPQKWHFYRKSGIHIDSYQRRVAVEIHRSNHAHARTAKADDAGADDQRKYAARAGRSNAAGYRRREACSSA